MRIYIANLGKYNEGELVGAWFTPPIDFDEVKERIGLNDEYEEYAIHDYELPFEIDEYTPIEEVNRLCEMVEDLPEDIQAELHELQSYFGGIEELCEHEDDIIHYPDCEDMAISLKKQVLWARCRQACKTTLTMKPTGVTLKSAAVLLSRTTAYLKSLAKNLADHNPTGDVLTDSLFFGAASMLPHTLLERTDYMKKIRSYTSIWSVEKVLYSINDFKLPFPITFTQMTWFVVSLFAVMLLGNVPPLSMIDGAFLKYFGIPLALTWFMCQKTFDGKKPYGFLKSVIAYLVRPKLTYAGKTVKLGKDHPAESITAVRSEIYGISD